MESVQLEAFFDVRRTLKDAKAIYHFLQNDLQEFKESEGKTMNGIFAFGHYDKTMGLDLGQIVLVASFGQGTEQPTKRMSVMPWEFKDYFLRYLNENIENILEVIADKMTEDAKSKILAANEELSSARNELARYFKEIESRHI